MAEYLGNQEGLSHAVSRQLPVTSGVTVTDGDFVYQSGNAVTNASIAGKRLMGTVQGGNAGTLVRSGFTNTTVGDGTDKNAVLVNVEKDGRYLLKMAGTGAGSFSATDEGSYFNLTGSTGAQTADYATKSATTGQLLLVKYNPGIRGSDATYGIFVIAQNQRSLA